MHLKSTLASFAALALAGAAVPAAALTIDFETGAPCCFVSTSPLTNLYSGLGVTFAGTNGPGGSILDQSGNFGINARSGVDFLAFNGSASGNVELVTFASAASYFSIYVGLGSSQTYFADAYDAGSNLIGSATVTPGGGEWGLLSISAPNIAYVYFGTSSNIFVADDLSTDATAVPEPASWALMIAGFGMIGGALRRRSTVAA